MRMTLKQLKQLDVETASGTELGHVHDVVFEIDGQLVAQYVVKVSKWSAKSYLVSRDQVVRFEEYKMVVDDGVAREEASQHVAKSSVVKTEAVAMREQ